MKNRLKTFFSLLIIAILCIISVVCLTACLDTNTKTDKESDTETNPICETLMYGSGRYVSAAFENDRTGGSLYNFDMKYQGLSAQIYMGGGFIEGNTEQVINKGEFGSEVIAIPYDGFEFVKWSDGLTTPSRKDKSTYCFNVIDSARKNVRYNGVYPLFAKQHTVYFRATSGGRIQGELIQTIATGKSSSELIAIADEGYIFTGWYLENQYGMVAPGSFSNRITTSDTLLYDPFKHGLPPTNSYIGQGHIVAAFIEERN